MIDTVVIILNYNSAAYTIKCIESLWKGTKVAFQLIVVDNGSDDNSLNDLKQFFQANKLVFSCLKVTSDYSTCENIIISSGENKGFGGGHNLGLQWALNNPDIQYFWLLNSDLEIKSGALEHLISCASISNSQVGLLGSKVMLYERENVFQAFGGGFSKFTARSVQKGFMEVDSGQYDLLASACDFPQGAAIFVKRQFLMDVGLLDEAYFLFYEELDWAIRGRKMGYQVQICTNSYVFHHQGISTGNRVNSKRNYSSLYHQFRSLLLLYRKHFPHYLPIALFQVILRIVKFSITEDMRFFKLIPDLMFKKRSFEF